MVDMPSAGEALRRIASVLERVHPGSYPELVTLESFASEEKSSERWNASAWAIADRPFILGIYDGEEK